MIKYEIRYCKNKKNLVTSSLKLRIIQMGCVKWRVSTVNELVIS